MSCEIRIEDEEIVDAIIYMENEGTEVVIEFTCKKKGISAITVLIVIADRKFVLELDM